MEKITDTRHFIDNINAGYVTDKLQITDCKFECELDFGICQEVVRPLVIRNCVFTSQFTFNHNHIWNTLLIENCTFESDLLFRETIFHKMVELQGCEIQGQFRIENTIFNSLVRFSRNDYLEGSNVLNTFDKASNIKFNMGLELY